MKKAGPWDLTDRIANDRAFKIDTKQGHHGSPMFDGRASLARLNVTRNFRVIHSLASHNNYGGCLATHAAC